MAALWTWLLTDSQGGALAELSTAFGRSIEFVRNRYAEARCTISHEDTAAALLIDALNNTGIPRLKCYRRPNGTPPVALPFYGNLAPFSESLEETATMELVFRSPFARLSGDGSERGRFTSDLVSGGIYEPQDFPYPGTDAGQIAKTLIDDANANGNTGIATTGLIETTKPRIRTYQFANVGESIAELAGLFDGFDFYETFVDGASPMAVFNAVSKLGQDMPSVRFEYGPQTLSNVRSVNRTTQPPINYVTALGANGLFSVRMDMVSITEYGLWPLQVSASDVTDQAVLDDKAQGALRPNPVRTIEFAPDFGLSNCPKPWDDFWIGDTVRFYGRRGAFVENLSVRVNGFTVTIDESGFETFEVPDPTTPDEESTIRSNLSVEVV